MLRALIAVGFFATAICGVKGAPRPPESASLAGADGGAPDAGAAMPGSAELAPDATEIDPLHDPLALDAGCQDGGCR